MQSAAPSEPVLFLKPSTAYAPEGSPVLVPAYTRNLHHELELAVVMGKRCRAVSEAAAMDYVACYALCLDMTARDVQDECKKKGLPWTLAKSEETMWECRNCGHLVMGKKAPELCPVCAHPPSYFEVRKENY